MKKKIALFMVLISAMALIGCGTKETTSKESASSEVSESTKKETSDKKEKIERLSKQYGGLETAYDSSVFEGLKAKKEYKIAALHYSLTNEAPVILSEAMAKRAEELGVKVDMFDADGDVNTEIDKMQNIVSGDYDLILISAVDSEASVAAVDIAKEAGIPVINVHSYLESDDLVSTVVSDSIQAGEDIMKWAAEKMDGKGNIVIMEGPTGSSGQVLRYQGICNVLMDYPDIEVLATQTANWSRAEGLDLMQNWMQTFNDINAVVSENDEMGLGAIEALGNDKTNVYVTGVDGISDTLVSIKEGKQDMTMYQDTIGQGKLSIEMAVAYLNGDEVEKYYWIPYELVTIDNVDEYIDRVAKK